jgi:hypothetical protein
MKMDLKKLKEVTTMCWERYHSHMTRGEMRQRPGRSEYTIELINAGMLEKGQKGWGDFFFNVYCNPKSPEAKTIMRVERKMQNANGRTR